jgi:hypothetical protein
VLGPELVTDLVTEGTNVSIGGRLQLNTEHYEPRVFKRNIWLPKNALLNQDTYPDIFAVSGMEMNDLRDIIPSDEEVGNFYFDERADTDILKQNYNCRKRFIVIKGRNLKSSFSKLCEMHRKETLHWLKYKNKELLWKETRGDINNLLSCIVAEKTHEGKRIIVEFMKRGNCEINEESARDLDERIVLVVAQPGMGKSSTTTQVAWHTKLADPISWVVLINWNDHSKKLQEINKEAFNLDSLVEFLCSAASLESKYADINRRLLKQALQNRGNITVLMDGFDEISPTHVDKADVILNELKNTKVGKVWVTSRPVQKEYLESQLSVTAFGMKKLSDKSQVKIFMDILKKKANTDDDAFLNVYVEEIRTLVNQSVYQRNFTAYPLHIVMIATAIEENFKRSLETKVISLPGKLDIMDIFGMFIERKLLIYETEKKREDLSKAGVQDDHEMLKKISVENLEKCSLLVTLQSEPDLLREERIQSTIQPFLERLQAGKDKIGIIMNVVEDRPQFVHRTIAEYCTARWFSKNFKSNIHFLRRSLFDSSYGIVRNVFNRIVARGFTLH